MAPSAATKPIAVAACPSVPAAPSAQDIAWPPFEEDQVEPGWLSDPAAWEAPRPEDPEYDEVQGFGVDDETLAGQLAAWPPAGVLGATAPGPDLASLLAAVDTVRADENQLIAAAAAAARLASWATSREVDATIGLLHRVRDWRGVDANPPPGRPCSVTPERMVASELGAAMDLSPLSAGNRVRFAAALRRLPATRAALADGRVDWPKAKLVVDLTASLDDSAAAAAEAEAMAWAPVRTYSDLRRKLTHTIIAVDPSAAERRHQTKVDERSAGVFELPDGMSQLSWVDSAETIDAFYRWLTGRAMRARAPGDPRTLDQRRADVMADLGRDGLAHDDLPKRAGREPRINVVVAATTLLGLDEMPGELVGYGPVTAETARRIAGDGTWQRILFEPRTGRFDEMSVDSYEPPQDLRDHVIARDRTCRAPGCRIRADSCDLDHHVPHPRGPTAPENLGPFCRPFHEVKTFTDTLVERDDDDGLWITLPSGRTYYRPCDAVLEHLGRQSMEEAARERAVAKKQVAERSSKDDIPPF